MVQITHMTSALLPEVLSPCANVRRTCYLLMGDEPCFATENGATATKNQDGAGGERSVMILNPSLQLLAETITRSILSDSIKEHRNNECLSEKSESESGGLEGSMIERCLDSEGFEFASWDADNWHYTGESYSRPHLPKTEEQKQRYERVALYICVLDCINFCFWPVDDKKKEMEDCGTQQPTRNSLEYEHLAIALKKIAEEDDNLSSDISMPQAEIIKSMGGSQINTSSPAPSLVQAEDSYALAPQNLVKLSPSQFRDKITPHLPKYGSNSKVTENIVYTIPNIAERSRLMIELSQSLLTFHSGSATMLISKSHHSADRLVHLILQTCPGFRDTAIDGYHGRWVAFYKRAQILCADLWAALGNGQRQKKNASTNITSINSGKEDPDFYDNDSTILDYCHFYDMDNITTFADYRVPQLLRHLGVLAYSPHLGGKVDNGVELVPCSADELYIRAGTVVAVDQLVKAVRSRLQLKSNQDDGDEHYGTASSNVNTDKDLWKEVNAVKLDWYLWNIGEKLDREGSLKNHHKVRTIFY